MYNFFSLFIIEFSLKTSYLYKIKGFWKIFSAYSSSFASRKKDAPCGASFGLFFRILCHWK